jgi:hypothetical protein
VQYGIFKFVILKEVKDDTPLDEEFELKWYHVVLVLVTIVCFAITIKIATVIIDKCFAD